MINLTHYILFLLKTILIYALFYLNLVIIDDEDGKMDKIEFNLNVDRLNSPMAMTGFPTNPSMYATKTTAMKQTSVYSMPYSY